jgi:hypothetical protein
LKNVSITRRCFAYGLTAYFWMKYGVALEIGTSEDMYSDVAVPCDTTFRARPTAASSTFGPHFDKLYALVAHSE